MKKKILLICLVLMMGAVILSSCATTNPKTTSSTKSAVSSSIPAQASSQISSTISSSESLANTSNLDIAKANTPSQIFSTWQPVEIAFFKDRNYIILIDQMIKNDSILFAYSEIKDTSTIYFGVYDIKQNKFNKLDYKISDYKANNNLYFIQETANKYYVMDGNTIYILNSDNKKIDSISDINTVKPYVKNIISNDDKYLVNAKSDIDSDKYEIYLFDINNKTSKMIYTFKPTTAQKNVTWGIDSAYFINNNDILIKTGALGGNGENGIIIDVNGDVVEQFRDMTNITFETNDKYIYYNGWSDASLSEEEIGIFDLDKNVYNPILKNQDTVYDSIDFKNNSLLYAEYNQKTDNVSLKTVNVETKKISMILENHTNFDGYRWSDGQYTLSQDGKYTYYQNDYCTDGQPNNNPEISFLFIKKIM